MTTVDAFLELTVDRMAGRDGEVLFGWLLARARAHGIPLDREALEHLQVQQSLRGMSHGA